MSFSHTYFEELRAQSKDLVEILAHTQEERVLYALCVVYQQLAFAEQDPPADAEDLLQQHADRLEKYVQSKDIDSMLYQLVEADVPDVDYLHDVHELAFVLNYLDIEEDYLDSMVNIQKVIQSFPEQYTSLCAHAQKLFSISVHPSRFFDDVLQTIIDTAQAEESEPVRLSDDQIDAIFKKVEAEEAEESVGGIVIHVDFAGLNQSTTLEAADVRMTADTGIKKSFQKKLFENERFQIALIRRNTNVSLYLIPKGEPIEKPIVKRNEELEDVQAFSKGWSWKYEKGVYLITIEEVVCKMVIQDES